MPTHYIAQSYQGDVDTVSGSSSYTAPISDRLDVPLAIPITVSGQITSVTTVATVTTTSAHNLLVGTNVTISGCTGGTATNYNITAAITSVPTPTTFTYTITSTSGSPSTGTPAYVINYYAVTISIAYAKIASMILQSDVPCRIDTNNQSSPVATITLYGSLTTSTTNPGIPTIIPSTSAATVFASTNVTAFYVYNATTAGTTGTYNNAATTAGTLKVRYLLNP